jgi:hypothetical protein
MSNKKNTAATAAATQTEKSESSLDGLKIEDVKIFKGLFTAWRRNVTDRNDKTKKVLKYKCICQVPDDNGKLDANGFPVRVDISAWLTKELAEKYNIGDGDSFVGTFAYSDVRLESPRGQYNEERSLNNARLISVLS